MTDRVQIIGIYENPTYSVDYGVMPLDKSNSEKYGSDSVIAMRDVR